MRIIGGEAAGIILEVPKGLGVRPTPDKVRQAIFNSLGEFVHDAAVLELFGGTGALSLECLSRGAKSAVCVEKSPKHARFIRGNLMKLPLGNKSFDLRIADAFAAIRNLLEQNVTFDLILADPPFGEKTVDRCSESFSQRMLNDPDLPALLNQHGRLVLGHAKRDQVSVPAIWRERKILKHGDSIFRILEPAQSAQEQPLLARPT
jgi:16S rRNA (guanine(966)-N(2))-methyltransferase RsmD